jgi:hypothetical protein
VDDYNTSTVFQLSDVNSVMLGYVRPVRPAQKWTPGAQSAETVKTAPVVHGVEIDLPPVGTYAAVELG